MLRGPDFFVVGAPKAATTSLYRWLRQHPDIFVPPIKEPHHFSMPEVSDTYYEVRLFDQRDDYLALYRDRGDEKRAGDFSSSYLYRTAAADRIRRFNPDALIIAVLRNPIDRAVSHYRMDVREGYTSRGLDELLDDSDGPFRREYIDVGRYSHQLRVWQNTFPAEQMLILMYEDLAADPASVVARIQEFLGVAVDVPSNIAEHFNVRAAPRSPTISRAARRINGAGVGRLLRPSLRRRLRNLTVKDAKPLETGVRERVAREFQSEIDQLELTLGRSLGHWRS